MGADHHRSRFNTFFVVDWWHPEAALRQRARQLLRALNPQPGEKRALMGGSRLRVEVDGAAIGHTGSKVHALVNHDGRRSTMLDRGAHSL